MTTVTLPAPGMGCSACEQTLHLFLDDHPGVDTVEPDHRTGQVHIRYDPERATLDQLRERIRVAGYD